MRSSASWRPRWRRHPASSPRLRSPRLKPCYAEEVSASAAIATAGADLLGAPDGLLPPNARIMTHCNAGALAVPGGGTALAVIAELTAGAPLTA